MWVAPSTRGLGLGRRLLTELERLARDHGARMIRLETHRSLSEAIAFYRSAGYHEVPPFNDEPTHTTGSKSGFASPGSTSPSAPSRSSDLNHLRPCSRR
jgi:N-acetylglutamate synthase-like GNAT family acetyltransferase